jgi:hypothetical protein
MLCGSSVTANPSATIGPRDEGPSRMGAVLLALWCRRLAALTGGGFERVDVPGVVTVLVAAAERGGPGGLSGVGYPAANAGLVGAGGCTRDGTACTG